MTKEIEWMCPHVSMVWNKDGQNWVCELCGKGLTEGSND